MVVFSWKILYTSDWLRLTKGSNLYRREKQGEFGSPYPKLNGGSLAWKVQNSDYLPLTSHLSHHSQSRYRMIIPAIQKEYSLMWTLIRKGWGSKSWSQRHVGSSLILLKFHQARYIRLYRGLQTMNTNDIWIDIHLGSHKPDHSLGRGYSPGPIGKMRKESKIRYTACCSRKTILMTNQAWRYLHWPVWWIR